MSSLTFICSSCQSLNRVPEQRRDQAAKCGKCKQHLSTDGHPVDVDDARLSALIAASPVPVLVDFWAPWCGPCRVMGPELVELGRRHAGQIVIVKINVDHHKGWAQRLGVQGIPMLATFRGGKLVKSEAGLRRGAELERWVFQP